MLLEFRSRGRGRQALRRNASFHGTRRPRVERIGRQRHPLSFDDDALRTLL
jgi:hypothetical protein